MTALAYLVPVLAGAQAPDLAERESEFHAVDYLHAPEGERLEIGGIGLLPASQETPERLVVSTRRGQVWMVENPLAADPGEARFSLFAEGLWEGLGLAIVDREVLVLQRGELSRLSDFDHDGRCDRIDTLCDDWGLSGNYHEFAYGLPVDAQGNAYLSLNVSFFSPKWWHGKSPVPYRGWALRITPAGELQPVASGFRSPAGISLSPEGELFVTDNQGDWMPASPIFHVREGGFYGHPASLDWTEEYRATDTHASDTIPPERAAKDRRPAAVWLPYKWSRSPGDMAWDESGGKFGPFEHQFFLSEMTNGMVLRGQLEEVQGELQGWVLPFRTHVGSAVRTLFAPDGTLLVGFTNRGWGGYSPADGIARIRWTGKRPMEVRSVHLLATLGDPASGTASDGDGGEPGGPGGIFELEFTQPLSAELAHGPDSVRVTQYRYDFWWEYGSPEREQTELEAYLLPDAADRTRARVIVPGLRPGRMARVRLSGIAAADGTPLLHDEFAYTVNQFPLGQRTDEPIARLVPPPPARESGDEGWLFLTYTDALAQWEESGWLLCDAELDPEDKRRFLTKEGNGAIVNVGPDATHLVSKPVFGDCKLHLLFQLPEGGNSGVYLMGRYEVQLADTAGKETGLEMGDCGGLYRGESWPGRAPDFNAYRGSALWHDLDVDFQAPRFDADGTKTENARFLRVRLDDTLLHEDIELPEPTLGALGPEVAVGPLLLQGDHTQVAYADVRVFPKVPRLEPEGWTPLFDGESLEEWPVSMGEPADAGSEAGAWTVEDGVIIGSGKTSHLFSPRDDYRNFELRGRFKISDGGNSGFYFRAAFGPGWPAGYEAQINATFSDPQKTGSLYGLVPSGTTLVPPDNWFDYFVRCVDEESGTHITLQVNGVTFVDFVDTERRHASGHIALQQHHEGSVIEAKELWIRELP